MVWCDDHAMVGGKRLAVCFDGNLSGEDEEVGKEPHEERDELPAYPLETAFGMDDEKEQRKHAEPYGYGPKAEQDEAQRFGDGPIQIAQPSHTHPLPTNVFNSSSSVVNESRNPASSSRSVARLVSLSA